MQCVILKMNLPKIWGGNQNAFVAGSRDTLVSGLPTSPALPRWLAFDSVVQFHVSLGCYLQPSHRPVHLVRRGHSLRFCRPCKGCSWQLNPRNSLPMVTPRGREQRAVTEEDSVDGTSLPQPSQEGFCCSLRVKMLCFSWQWF